MVSWPHPSHFHNAVCTVPSPFSLHHVHDRANFPQPVILRVTSWGKCGVVYKMQKTVNVPKAFSRDSVCNGTKVELIPAPVVFSCWLRDNSHEYLETKVCPELLLTHFVPCCEPCAYYLLCVQVCVLCDVTAQLVRE